MQRFRDGGVLKGLADDGWGRRPDITMNQFLTMMESRRFFGLNMSLVSSQSVSLDSLLIRLINICVILIHTTKTFKIGQFIPSFESVPLHSFFIR